MGLHGKGVFGQRRTAGMPWLNCPDCGKRHYLRDRNYEIQWRKDPRCMNCQRKSVNLEELLKEFENDENA